jgi:hypothetical protein
MLAFLRARLRTAAAVHETLEDLLFDFTLGLQVNVQRLLQFFDLANRVTGGRRSHWHVPRLLGLLCRLRTIKRFKHNRQQNGMDHRYSDKTNT